MIAPDLDAQEVERLRREHYNATLIGVTSVHDDLRILRVVPDGGIPPFRGGQFTSLGLGYWEPRIDGAQEEPLDPSRLRRVVKRAYSLSCSLLDERGEILTAQRRSYFEFYVALVRYSDERPPSLTPRLFALAPGQRLFAEERVAGAYTLEGVAPTDNVLFLATGTGEAPHNAMIAELVVGGHRGRIASAVSVRHRHDLAYADAHRRLESRLGNYRYLALTTREPENLDAGHPSYVGKRHLQDYVRSGDLERDIGWSLDPKNTHVFLCGNPAMIGVPVRVPGSDERHPQPGGMIELLVERGFVPDAPRRPGNVHFERYW
jgi:ferredoxin--NADP+ reductase